MTTHPAPWRTPAPRRLLRARSLGQSLADFQNYLGDRDFASAWGQVQSQLTAEGTSDVGRVNNIKTTFLSAYEQLGTANGSLSSGNVATAAAQYVLTGQTIAGAVNTINGLISTVQSADPGTVVNTFTGTLIGSVVLTGALATGVGAAIVGAVSGLVAILKGAGLLSAPPLGVEICPGFYCNPASAFSVGLPGAPGCVCVNPDDPTNTQIQPGSFNWRAFPLPGVDTDWFSTSKNSTHWKAATWGGPPNTRLIDAAFPTYHQLECELQKSLASSIRSSGLLGPISVGGIDPFLAAFFSAWQRNAEWTLNGLQSTEDAKVLVHVLRLWNTSHANTSTSRISAISLNPYVPGAPCNGVQSYVAMLVGRVQSLLGSNDPDIFDSSSGQIIINTGAPKNPPVVTALVNGGQQTGSSSTLKKAAIGAGIAAAGVGAWAYMNRMSYGAAWRRIYAMTLGRIL